ncbi:MAG: TadE/TadG family type IV pilus assembly protein [Clostridia bacterium]|nr:TadE/TadG family type IV pilus assembly protein [Clostridia bacterium]MDD4048808.1 TadE/TadG family type IV pilus assembly protein [Clostridia bacterium]
MIKNIFSEKKGQGLVEMAIVLPLLLLLLFGIIEFGRVIGAEIMVIHSARDGARCGSVGASDSEIINKIQNGTGSILSSQDPTQVSVSIVRTGSGSGGDIEVSVSFPVVLYIPIVSSITGNPINVSGTSVMRLE